MASKVLEDALLFFLLLVFLPVPVPKVNTFPPKLGYETNSIYTYSSNNSAVLEFDSKIQKIFFQIQIITAHRTVISTKTALKIS